MPTTVEYLELLRDALAKRTDTAYENEDYALRSALQDAADCAQSLVDALRYLERFQ